MIILDFQDLKFSVLPSFPLWSEHRINEYDINILTNFQQRFFSVPKNSGDARCCQQMPFTSLQKTVLSEPKNDRWWDGLGVLSAGCFAIWFVCPGKNRWGIAQKGIGILIAFGWEVWILCYVLLTCKPLWLLRCLDILRLFCCWSKAFGKWKKSSILKQPS